jgi:hypothetical protein
MLAAVSMAAAMLAAISYTSPGNFETVAQEHETILLLF